MRALLKAFFYLVAAVALTGLYGLCNYAGLYLKSHYDGLSPLWPTAGIGVVLLWQYGLRWWPVVVVGEVLSTHYFGRSWAVSGTDALSQIAEALAATGILRWFAVDAQFPRTRDVLLFVFAAALPASLLGGLVGVLGQGLNGLIPEAAVYGITQLPNSVESSFYFLLLPLAVLVSARAGAAGASSAALLMALCVLVFNLQDVQAPFLAAMRVAFVAAAAFTGYLVAAA